MSNIDDINNRRAKRVSLLADVDLEINAEIIDAMVVDVSDTGVRIDTCPPLIVNLRFVIDGKLQDRKAQLAWCRKTPEGCMTYGFECIDGESDKKTVHVKRDAVS
jgi:PilZ domain